MHRCSVSCIGAFLPAVNQIVHLPCPGLFFMRRCGALWILDCCCMLFDRSPTISNLRAFGAFCQPSSKLGSSCALQKIIQFVSNYIGPWVTFGAWPLHFVHLCVNWFLERHRQSQFHLFALKIINCCFKVLPSISLQQVALNIQNAELLVHRCFRHLLWCYISFLLQRLCLVFFVKASCALMCPSSLVVLDVQN